MEEALRALLLADAGVAALADQRVSWGMRPRGSLLPSIALLKVSGGGDYVMEGTNPPFEARVQVDCWGSTYASAKGLARAAVLLLSGYKGTISGITFPGIFLDAERDLSDDGTDAEDEIFRISLDFTLWFQNA